MVPPHLNLNTIKLNLPPVSGLTLPLLWNGTFSAEMNYQVDGHASQRTTARYNYRNITWLNMCIQGAKDLYEVKEEQG